MSGSDVERIVETPSTSVGPHMGRAAVDALAKKLGLDLGLPAPVALQRELAT